MSVESDRRKARAERMSKLQNMGASSNGASGNGAGKETPKPKSTPRKRTTKLEGQLQEFFAGCALMVQVAGDDFSAEVIASRGDDLARAWSDLASKNPSVERVLKTLVEGSAWTQATVVTLSVAIPIAWHHNLIPDSIGSKFAQVVGVVPASEEVKRHTMKSEPVSGYKRRGKPAGGEGEDKTQTAGQ